MSKQTNLNEKSKKFWGKASEGTRKHRFVNFIDGVSESVVISDWNIQTIESPWGKKQAIVTDDGRFLKLDSIRLRWELEQFVGKKSNLIITRYDSDPNPLNTWYEVVEQD